MADERFCQARAKIPFRKGFEKYETFIKLILFKMQSNMKVVKKISFTFPSNDENLIKYWSCALQHWLQA
jgi:hypothetical protein